MGYRQPRKMNFRGNFFEFPRIFLQNIYGVFTNMLYNRRVNL